MVRGGRGLSASALLLAYLVAGAAAVTTAAVARRLVPGLHPVLAAAAADLLATIVVFAFSAGFDNSSIYDPVLERRARADRPLLGARAPGQCRHAAPPGRGPRSCSAPGPCA